MLEQPKMIKIVKNDYVAVLALCFSVVIPVMLVLGALTGFFISRNPRVINITDVQVTLIFTLVPLIFLAGMAAVGLRVSYIKKILSHGTPVTGRITSILRFKDRGRVEFEYEYGGITYRSGVAMHRSGETLALREGDAVELRVDRTRPEKALIAALYL